MPRGNRAKQRTRSSRQQSAASGRPGERPDAPLPPFAVVGLVISAACGETPRSAPVGDAGRAPGARRLHVTAVWPAGHRPNSSSAARGRAPVVDASPHAPRLIGMALPDQGALALDLSAAILDTRIVPDAPAAPTTERPGTHEAGAEKETRRHSTTSTGATRPWCTGCCWCACDEVDDLFQDVFLSSALVRCGNPARLAPGWPRSPRHRATITIAARASCPTPTVSPAREEPSSENGRWPCSA